QWLAGRERIAPASPLYQPRPVPVRAVVSLGGLADLRREAGLIKASCGRDTVQLAGSASDARPDVFSDTNAADLLPNGSHTVLVTGELDTISPPRVAWQYAARAQTAGDSARVVILPGASHYDEVAASSPAWPQVSAAIDAALQAVSAAR
ncbi:MAG TPA: alpha/beta hydrolase, partial [Telluria sp.]